MKKLSELKGFKVLSKKEQNKVNGAMLSRPYCAGPNRCCVDTFNGLTLCEHGRCHGNGFCSWS